MHVCFFDFAAFSTEELADEAKHWVKDENLGKHRKSQERQRAFLAGRIAAGKCLAAMGQIGYIEPDPHWGFLRFYSQDTRSIYVNVSHTQSVAAAAVANWPVGIDVERLDRDATRVFKRITSEREQARGLSNLNLDGESIPVELAYWSAKESFSKALGLGIKFGMRDLEIDFSGPGPYKASTRLSGPLSLIEPRVMLVRHENYLISLCSESRAFDRSPVYTCIPLK